MSFLPLRLSCLLILVGLQAGLCRAEDSVPPLAVGNEMGPSENRP